MSKKFPHGIDLFAPGGLAELFAVHRAISGDLVMEGPPDPPPAPAQPPAVPPMPAVPPQVPAPVDDAAAQLVAANTAREKAESDLAAARVLLQAADDAKLSDIEKANKAAADTATENARLKTDIARLTALSTHPVPAEYQHLVTGTDAATYEASAKAISALAAAAAGKTPPPTPIPRSGDRTHDNTNTGGSVAAGAALYEARKK